MREVRCACDWGSEDVKFVLQARELSAIIVRSGEIARNDMQCGEAMCALRPGHIKLHREASDVDSRMHAQCVQLTIIAEDEDDGRRRCAPDGHSSTRGGKQHASDRPCPNLWHTRPQVHQ